MRLRTEGSGPLVIKVAGLAGGVRLYDEEIDAARAAGFRVGALDTTGDRADDPATVPLDWEFLAGEVVGAIDRLGADRAVLWGTSFGSLVCLAVAARRPERVRGLLLCSPPEPGWRPAVHLAAYRWTSSGSYAAAATTRWFNVGFMLLNAWEFVSPVALARLPGLARAAFEASTPATTVHEKLGMLFRDDPGRPRAESAIPCSIIAGAWDTVTFPGAARRVAAVVPGARVRLLRFAGHSCAYARPRTYARWSIEELRRLSS